MANVEKPAVLEPRQVARSLDATRISKYSHQTDPGLNGANVSCKAINMVLVYSPAVDDDWTRTPPIALVHFPGRGRAERHTDKRKTER